MDSLLWDIPGGLLGGFLAWFAATIVGRPLYTYRSLRSEAARLVSLYEHNPKHISIDQFLPGCEDSDWLIERRRAYRACGTQFLALAATNAFLTEVLQKCRRDPQMAGYALVTLGNMNPQSDAAHQIQKTLISALKLN